MKIIVLSDNRSVDPQRFEVEHGLCVWLQTAKHQLLLDTGASDVFVRNAERLGVDLTQVDYVFLSHGHADHTGGLRAFLSINQQAKVIVSPQSVSGQFYSKRNSLHSITAQWPLVEMQDRTISVSQGMEIDDGLRIIAHVPQNHPVPMGNKHLFVMDHGQCVPDGFCHELALYADGLLFTGCAHSGVENILDACPWPVHTVLGGFHLLDAHHLDVYESDPVLTSLAQRLMQRYPETHFYTSHCTGDHAFATLKAVMGSHLDAFACGMEIER